MVYNGKPWKTLLKWMIWGYHYFWKHPVMNEEFGFHVMIFFKGFGKQTGLPLNIFELLCGQPCDRKNKCVSHLSIISVLCSRIRLHASMSLVCWNIQSTISIIYSIIHTFEHMLRTNISDFSPFQSVPIVGSWGHQLQLVCLLATACGRIFHFLLTA